jgi:hypothetical protein
MISSRYVAVRAGFTVGCMQYKSRAPALSLTAQFSACLCCRRLLHRVPRNMRRALTRYTISRPVSLNPCYRSSHVHETVLPWRNAFSASTSSRNPHACRPWSHLLGMPYIIVTAVVSLPCQPPPGPPGPYGPPPGNYMPYPPPQHGHPGYYGQYPGAPPQPGYPPQPYYNYPPPPGPVQSGAGEAPAKPPGAGAPPQAPPPQTQTPAHAQPTVCPHAQTMAATVPYRVLSHVAVLYCCLDHGA